MDLAPFVERARPKLTPDEFLAAVEARRAAFDGLLDDEALALLVLDELGLNEDAVVSIAQARGRAEATVEARVVAVPSRRTFARRDGATGEVTNVALEDTSGRATLVLWDRDGDKATGLTTGARVRIVNARVKESKFGLELHASAWTVIEVPGRVSPAKAKLLADVADQGAPPADPPGSLEGEVVRVLPTQSFLKETGGVGFAAEVVIRTNAGERTVTLEDERIREIRALPPGVRVRLTGLNQAAGAYTSTGTTRLERVT